MTPVGENGLAALLAALTIVGIALMVVALVLLRRLRLVTAQYRLLMQGPSGDDLDIVLRRFAADLDGSLRRVDTLERFRSADRAQLEKCVQRVGMVRFSAFSDTGSDLSFAAAFLNEQGDGVVLTSLFGRDQSRTYAKPIQGAQSTYVLTDEEKKAIASAMFDEPKSTH